MIFNLAQRVSARDELLDQPVRTRHRSVGAIMRSTRDSDAPLQELIAEIAFSTKRRWTYAEVEAVMNGLGRNTQTLEDWCYTRQQS